MSDIGRGVHTYLQTKAAVTSICGSRGYPDVLEQGATLPAYVYRVVDADSNEHLKGASGLAHTRLQIDCYASTSITANELREQIRRAMQGYRGAAGSETIRGCSQAGKFDTYQLPLDGGDGRYVYIIDFLISHTETVPTF